MHHRILEGNHGSALGHCRKLHVYTGEPLTVRTYRLVPLFVSPCIPILSMRAFIFPLPVVFGSHGPIPRLTNVCRVECRLVSNQGMYSLRSCLGVDKHIENTCNLRRVWSTVGTSRFGSREFPYPVSQPANTRKVTECDSYSDISLITPIFQRYGMPTLPHSRDIVAPHRLISLIRFCSSLLPLLNRFFDELHFALRSSTGDRRGLFQGDYPQDDWLALWMALRNER